MGREAQRSDGLLDFLGALGSHPRPDVVPVERVSGRAGTIVAAHAEADGSDGTQVTGILHKGFGYGGVYNAHIDVKVLGPNRQLITGLATNYFPRPIPNDYRSKIGRSWFSTRLPLVPKTDSTMQVAYHPIAQADCEFSRSLATSAKR